LSVTGTNLAARSRRRKKRAVRSQPAAAAGQRGQKRPRRSVKPHPRSPSAEPDVRLKVGRQEPSPEEVQAWARQAAARMFDGPRRPMGLTRNDFEQAWSRVGKTDEERARWLLDFAARDLSALSSADWLNLRWEVFGFLYPPSGDPPPFSSGNFPDEPSCSADQVRRMHRWLRSGLERLKSGEGHSWAVPLAATPRLMMFGGRLVTWPDADVPYTESFKLKAYEALGRQARRFRVCAKCRRPFLARKRQAYCSKRCSQTVRTTKYRAAHRQKVNESRMRAYYARRRKASATPRSGQTETAATSNPRDVSRDDQRKIK
jgi:hypothetical protein